MNLEDLETHVYIIYGVYGGLIGLSLLLNIILCTLLQGLKASMKKHAILSKRGYSTYTGQEQFQQVPMQQSRQTGNGYDRHQQQQQYSQNFGHGQGQALASPSRPLSQQAYISQGPPARGMGQPFRDSYGGFDNEAFDTAAGYYEKDKTPGGVRVLPGGGGNGNDDRNKAAAKKVGNFLLKQGKKMAKDELKDMAKEEAGNQLKEKFGGLW